MEKQEFRENDDRQVIYSVLNNQIQNSSKHEYFTNEDSKKFQALLKMEKNKQAIQAIFPSNLTQ